jgi:hypothetical protein
MNVPLHQFLTETFDKDALREASIVADNATGRSSQAAMYYTDDEDSSDDDLLSIGHVTVSLHSLPSLTSNSSVSRWDSCISSPRRGNDSCKSPPGRPTRGYVNVMLDKMSTDPIRPIHLLHHHHHHMSSHTTTTTTTTTTTAAKNSDYLKNRLHTPPAAPRRKISFQGIPRPPCLEALVSSSPNSVRVDLSELLSKALEECGDLGEPYCSDSTSMSNTNVAEETVCVLVPARER